MNRRIRSIPLLHVLGLILMIQCAGCITASIATVGAVLDAASSAVTTGSDVYQLGKLNGAVMGSYVECCNAVRLAAADLRLHIIRDYKTGKRGDIGKFRLQDDLKNVTDIVIERRAERLCLCEVNVGFFGSEPTASLIMDRIRQHLPTTPTTRPEHIFVTGDKTKSP
jgi:hypothetical protein